MMRKKLGGIIILMAFLGVFMVGAGCGDASSSEVDGAPESVDVGDEEEGREVGSLAFTIVETHQGRCYDDVGSVIDCPARGTAFSGQDAEYLGLEPTYTDNGDGTISDENTGLMWQQDPGEKVAYEEAVKGAASLALAGYDDWRLPTIKELYSLILFDGMDPDPTMRDASGLLPFLDDEIFAFDYGDPDGGERIIDSQWATSSIYTADVMGGNACFFGVNFADGRIKCYPTTGKTYFARYVRGPSEYGLNDFQDLGDGTIADHATGLHWMQEDSGEGMLWEDALAFCEDLVFAGDDDWRLPDAKELQSIIDYSRSPDLTASAAIDPIFEVTPISDEGGEKNFPFYWTSTSHVNADEVGSAAVYIAFGEALGWMQDAFGQYQLMDVHGAGAQRSDPKFGDPNDYPVGRGPQGDVIRIYNFVRCVRTLDEEA